MFFYPAKCEGQRDLLLCNISRFKWSVFFENIGGDRQTSIYTSEFIRVPFFSRLLRNPKMGIKNFSIYLNILGNIQILSKKTSNRTWHSELHNISFKTNKNFVVERFKLCVYLEIIKSKSFINSELFNNNNLLKYQLFKSFYFHNTSTELIAKQSIFWSHK